MAKDYGTTWWGQQWLEALTDIDYENRIPRGKTYANTGKVYHFTIQEDKGLIKARVTGNYDPFYSVKIKLPLFTAKEKKALIDAIAKSPVVLSKLAARQLDPEIVDIAKDLSIKVFPTSWKDFDFDCSCPDFAVPCKHIAAVIYIMSTEIDANPFLLFSLRGLNLIAELEKRGLTFEQAQNKELVTWKSFLNPYKGVGKRPLESLEDLTFTPIKNLKDGILNLLAETAAGYTDGSLKKELEKTLVTASKLASAQLKDKEDRDIPNFYISESKPFIRVDSFGRFLINEDVSVQIHPSVGEPYTIAFNPKNGGEIRPLYTMFSGFLNAKSFEKDPLEYEALFNIWIIASRLVESSAIIAQIYEPIDDFFRIRWLPAFINDEIRKLVTNVGLCAHNFKSDILKIDRVDFKLDPLELGKIVLSAFIESYIKAAFQKNHEDNLHNCRTFELRSLFLGEDIDIEDALGAEASRMRLEAWLQPLYMQKLVAKPVIVITDLLDDRSIEVRSELFENYHDDLLVNKNVDVPELTYDGDVKDAESSYRDRINAIYDENDDSFDENLLKAHVIEDDKEDVLDAIDVDFVEDKKLDSDNYALDYEGMVESLEDDKDDEEVGNTDDAAPLESDDIINGESSICIDVGFEGSDNNGKVSFLHLNEIINDDNYSSVRFECLRTISRLSDIEPEFINVLKNDNYTCVMPMKKMADLLYKAIPSLNMLGIKLILPKSLRKILSPKASLKLDLSDDFDFEFEGGLIHLSELLTFDWKLAIGDRSISEDCFRELLNEQGHVVRIKDNFVYLDPKQVTKLKKRLDEHSQKAKAISKAALITAAITGEFEDSHVFMSDALKEALSKLFDDKDIPLPTDLNAKLRPYQERGYSWLVKNMRASIGSIIADDMGLGKTLQVIASLEKMREDGVLEKEPALVVVPTTLLTNWVREINKFAPKMRYSLFYSNQKVVDDSAHIVLTTYGTLTRNADKELKKHKFSVLVLDEAQAIKNNKSLNFKSVKKINAKNAIAMSGTPVENKLQEYWSIMEFTNPGLLGSAEKFKTEFARPIENERNFKVAERFKKITAPFILRRLKSDKSIISDLPDKIVDEKYCKLSPAQTALYQSKVQTAIKRVEESESAIQRSAMVLQMIQSLKQICNTPALYDEDSRYDKVEDSGKAEMLFELLDSLLQANRKVLIFTQFVRMGEILQKWIDERFDLETDFLHGSLSQEKRTKIVDSFQNDRSKKVLILSLKAAGTGLNLTSASAVIHYDLWWNPAVENQATDRAYRIGQKNKVNVYRLITENTFEEKINEIIQSKSELANMTVNAGENWIGSMSNRQLTEIFSLSED